MNSKTMLLKQTEDAYQWLNKLVESIPYEKWDQIPENVETNVTWQVGHLIMSFNFHSIMTIRGAQPELYQKFPIREYADLFINAQPSECVGKVEPEVLMEHCKIVQRKSLDIIASLDEADLSEKLEPTKVPHPIADVKFEALDWNIKHTMWHCGQIGVLKRVLDKRYDFGLKV
ncbi:DinB family protein [Flammeovirga aprica]|uniref:DinB family protein n=1 Tax=Flammeovirga aprica JL-4 TaxID=694437 RepID=A0A7X9RZA4_9BACT|nr:DinB family protein [Flammeovirga aprica]NME71435.1 DinB family protein [Flammeovirga aprica JL-4]